MSLDKARGASVEKFGSKLAAREHVTVNAVDPAVAILADHSGVALGQGAKKKPDGVARRVHPTNLGDQSSECKRKPDEPTRPSL